MFLRSSSAPALSALLPDRDTEASAFNRLSAAPQNIGFSLWPAPPMRRAHSDTDLPGVPLFSPAEADDQRRTGDRKKHLQYVKLPILEEKDTQLRVRVSDVDERHLVREDFMKPCSGQALSSVGTCGIPHVEEGERLMNPLLMASGIGIFTEADHETLGAFYGCDGGKGSSGGSNSRRSSSSHDDSDTTDLYYRKLLQSDPQNPLLLRNYAQFLSEAMHDYNKSEEYYERAILACPNDGEVLSRYAKHVWEVHKDSARAASYFDQAVKATPDDCYVLASYAAFLWESEEKEEGDEIVKVTQSALGSLHEMHAPPSPLMGSG